MDEFVDNFHEVIEAVDLFEECCGVRIILIQEVAGKKVNKELVEINSLEHVFVGEGREVVVDGLLLLEEDSFEEDIPVVIGVNLLHNGAALAKQGNPLIQDADQLLHLQWLEIDLNRDVLIDQEFS